MADIFRKKSENAFFSLSCYHYQICNESINKSVFDTRFISPSPTLPFVNSYQILIVFTNKFFSQCERYADFDLEYLAAQMVKPFCDIVIRLFALLRRQWYIISGHCPCFVSI